MLWRGLAVAAVLTLSGCVFSSEREFVSASDADQPFADGARFIWTESDDDTRRFDIAFRRTDGQAYDIVNAAEPEPIPNVRFMAIDETPEEDYIAQLHIDRTEGAVAYAFMWRVGDRYRLVSDPGRIDDDDLHPTADAYCTWRDYNECQLRNRDDMFALYRRLIYPRFVRGSETPESYLELSPPRAELVCEPPCKGGQ